MLAALVGQQWPAAATAIAAGVGVGAVVVARRALHAKAATTGLASSALASQESRRFFPPGADVQMTDVGRRAVQTAWWQHQRHSDPSSLSSSSSSKTAVSASADTTSARPAPSSVTPAVLPTVVLIHGFGCTSLEFADSVIPMLVDRGVAQSVFWYDRVLFVDDAVSETPAAAAAATASSSASSSAAVQARSTFTTTPTPAGSADTAKSLARELADALRKRGVQPPFVVCGHSYGGLIAQVFAELYATDVAGLVLVDPAHEHQYKSFPRDFALSFRLVPTILRTYSAIAWTGLLGFLDRFGLFNFPPVFLMHHNDLRSFIVRSYDGQAWTRARSELQGCNTTFATYQRASLSHPCTLIFAADRKHSPTRRPDAVTRAFVELHQPLADAGAKVIMAPHSDHWVHIQQPELVVDAIERMLVDVGSGDASTRE